MIVEQVTVSIQRRPDGRVTKARLDLLGVPALGDENRRACVPQVVESQPLREGCPLNGWPEVASHEVAMPDQAALGRCEQVLGARKGIKVLAQRLEHEARKAHAPDRARLRGAGPDVSAKFCKRLSDFDRAPKHVYPLEAQRPELPGPQARVDVEDDRGFDTEA